MKEILLSDSEKEILSWMWEADREYSYKDVFLKFGENSDKQWKKQTISTFLTRMEKKGVISIRKTDGKYYYKPALNKCQYERKRARYILDSFFCGSLNQFMVALNGGESLSDEDAAELRKFLED